MRAPGSGIRQLAHCALTVKALPKREPGVSDISTTFQDALEVGLQSISVDGGMVCLCVCVSVFPWAAADILT